MNVTDAIEELRLALRNEYESSSVVRVTVIMTYDEVAVSMDARSAEALEVDGVSMRNIAGKWIRPA